MDVALNLAPVAEWFDEVARSAQADSHASVHVDELLGEAFDAEPLTACISAFDDLARLAAGTGERQLAVLVIGLPPSVRMLSAPPSQPRRRWLLQSPPSLYLGGPMLWSRWGGEEEYRIPVDPPWLRSERGTAHYRVHRDEQARRRGWEYNRDFYVHAWPDQ